MRAPGHSKGDHSSALVEYIDIYPTLLELAGFAPPNAIEGTSFVPLLDRPATVWKDALYFYWNDKKLENGKTRLVDTVAIKTDRFLYTEWHDERERIDSMLFDHEEDPQENVNIAAEPGMQTTVRDLRQRIEAFKETSSFQRRGRTVPGVTPRLQKETK